MIKFEFLARTLPFLIAVATAAASSVGFSAEPVEPISTDHRPTLRQIPPSAPVPEGLRLAHVHPLTVLPLQTVSIGKIPPLLRDAVLIRRTYAAHRDLPEAGRLKIEVERDMPLFLGVSLSYEMPVDEDWYYEMMSLGTLMDDGWLAIGMQRIWNPQRQTEELYTVFFRECIAGEKFTVRTRKYLPPVLFTAPGPFPSLIDMEPSPGSSERLQKAFVGAKGMVLLKAERYDDLERWVGGYMQSETTFPSGEYRSEYIAYGFRWRTQFAMEERKPLIRLLEAWLAKYPESNAARLYAADFFIGYAESLEETGGDVSSEVDEAHRRALELLYEIEQSDPTNPQVFAIYLQLAYHQDWDEDLTADYFRRAMASKSWCPKAVSTYVGYFSRKYSDDNAKSQAKVQEAVEQAVAATRERYGDMMYAASLKGVDHFFADAPFYHLGYEWPRLRASFAELIKRYPDSRHLLLTYCKAASAAGDRETARMLFDKLGPYDPDDDDGWDNETDYRISQRWTADDYAEGDQRALFDLGAHAAVGLQWPEKGPLFLNRKGQLFRLEPHTGERKFLNQMAMVIQTGLACDEDGEVSAASAQLGFVSIANEKDTNPPREFHFRGNPTVAAAAVSRDGKQAVASVDGGKVYHFDLTVAELDIREDRTMIAADAGRVEFVAFAPDGKSIITYAQGDVRVWDAATLEMKRTWNAGNRGQIAAISPDGAVLAADTMNRRVQLWDANSGESLGIIPASLDRVGTMAFSPDGRLLAVGQGKMGTLEPSSIALLDVKNRTLIRTFGGHKGAVRGLAFSPDGKTLLSASTDRSVRVWEVPDVASLPEAAAGVVPPLGKPLAVAPAPPMLPRGASPRVLAESLLSLGASLSVAGPGGKLSQIKSVEALPSGEPEIHYVHIPRGDLLSDADLEAFASLPNLRRLTIQGSQITGSGIPHLFGLAELNHLAIYQSPLNDAGLEHIAKMTRLANLNIGFTAVTDAGLTKLSTLTELQVLFVQDNVVTDAAMPALAGLRKLESLNLDHTQVGDVGLASLTNLPKLKVLALRRTPITDRSTESLTKIKGLTTIYLEETGLSAGAIDLLQRELPKASVKRPK